MRSRLTGRFGLAHARHAAHGRGYDYSHRKHHHGYSAKRRKREIITMLLVGGAIIWLLIALCLR